MGRLALVGGNSIIDSPYGHEGRSVEEAGVRLLDMGSHLLMQRHGADGYTLPHAIDHAVNMRALAGLGADRVIALGSVGGMRPETPVGTFLAPDDFIAPGISPSIHAGSAAHAVPGFDLGWRSDVLDAWRRTGGPAIVDGGVYWQSRGPRFETAAEIRLFAAHAHVVGMTVASECVVAGELGLRYAAICTVDNLANGIGPQPLTVEEFQRGKEAGHPALLAALDALLPELSG